MVQYLTVATQAAWGTRKDQKVFIREASVVVNLTNAKQEIGFLKNELNYS